MWASIAMWIQYAGMAVAMYGGSPWPRPNLVFVAAGLVVIGVGITLKRWADRRDPRLAEGPEGASRSGSIGAATKALAAMVTGVDALVVEAATLPLGEIATRIEGLQLRGTEEVALAQDALTRKYSFARYAEMMGPLASGERWLYRAWSAASDGHRPEVLTSLASAVEFVKAANEKLAEITSTRAAISDAKART